MKPFRLSGDAERDLIEIAKYVAGKASLETAERVVAAIIETRIALSGQPNVGRPEERLGKGLKSFASGNYKIYYRPRKSGILILHVFHGARHQNKAWRSS